MKYTFLVCIVSCCIVGFAQGALRPKTNLAEVQQPIEGRTAKQLRRIIMSSRRVQQDEPEQNGNQAGVSEMEQLRRNTELAEQALQRVNSTSNSVTFTGQNSIDVP